MSDAFRAPRAVAVPAESLIADIAKDASLADAFAIRLPAGTMRDVVALARCLFASPPPWITSLMAIRDGVMGRLGIKTSAEMRKARSADRFIDFFRIQAVHETEVILGEDDIHLDFRASVLLRPDADGDWLIATTIVHCHNLLGRVYLAVITPFHRQVILSNLRRAAERGWPPAR